MDLKPDLWVLGNIWEITLILLTAIALRTFYLEQALCSHNGCSRPKHQCDDVYYELGSPVTETQPELPVCEGEAICMLHVCYRHSFQPWEGTVVKAQCTCGCPGCLCIFRDKAVHLEYGLLELPAMPALSKQLICSLSCTFTWRLTEMLQHVSLIRQSILPAVCS